jgi:mono/diheme cytochrome c family protein
MERASDVLKRRRGRRAACLVLGTGLTLLLAGCSSTGLDERTGTLPALDPGEVARGRAVYGQYCASCHGPRSEGAKNWTRPDASGNLPAPPHDDSGHTWRHGDKQLVELIQNGWRDRFNKTEALTMPPFKDKLSHEEIRAVIAFFKSLWSQEHRRWQFEESRRETLPSPVRRTP